MPLAARLSITDANSGTETVYPDAKIGAGDIQDVLRAADGEVELPGITVAIEHETMIGASSKRDVPFGLHRAQLEVSWNGGPWEVVIDGAVTYETIGGGRGYADGVLRSEKTRVWSVGVVNDALNRIWEALGEVELQDVAADLVANTLHEQVDFIRLGAATTPTISCRMWPVLAAVESALALASITAVGTVPDPFPWEQPYDDVTGGEPVLRLALRGESTLRTVLFGRPQLQGAPADLDLHGLHPTMPQESAGWLLKHWADAQQLRLSGRFAAYPSTDLELEIADVTAEADPAAAAFPEIEPLANDGWRIRTDASEVDGELIEDFAIVYADGPDGSAVEDAEAQPLLQAVYASARVAISGTPGERTADNRRTYELPWRLAAHNAIAPYALAADPGTPGYSETAFRGTPVFDIADAYVGPSGPVAEQDGSGDIVLLIVAERDDALDPWRSVRNRSATRTAGGTASGMALWATRLYPRFGLEYGDVDVVTCEVGEADLEAAIGGAVSTLALGDPRAGLNFEGYPFAVREVKRTRETKNVALTLVAPSGGWSAQPASGESGSGGTGQTGATQEAPTVQVLEISREETYEDPVAETDPITVFTTRFRAEVSSDSAAPTQIERDFVPALDPGEPFNLTTPSVRVLLATRIETEPGWGQAHPQEGRTFRARAVYPGFTSAWVAVTANE